MEKSVISLIKADSYNPEKIEKAIKKIFSDIDFDPQYFSGRKIGLKPNLLTSALPDSGIITHPVIIEAVIRIIKKNGGMPVLIESPAFHPLERVLKKTGLDVILERECVPTADTKRTVSIHNESGVKFKNFQVAEELASCDMIINLPKLKTHGLTYYTGAVKNLFGTINGLEKSKWHFRANTKEDFTSFLLDLYGAFLNGPGKKMIHIMDGILGLEGEGPGAGGRPVMGYALIGGTDAIAVDSIAVAVAGLNPRKVLTCIEGEKRGYGISRPEQIIIKGESLKSFNNKFREPEPKSKMTRWPMTSSVLKNLIVEKPFPQPEKCTLCYQCRTICPAGAISKTVNNSIPCFNYNKCIRCYCCMEICPENAIILKKGVIGRFMR
ncbi:MAG TPA: DUF362 domain-containing protein [Spirochaetota bacterium]|nr:DUF362 domain-containing protein [Spirochaetota bacterium]